MRSLAVGPWSAAQVAEVLRAGTGRYGCRFEILNRQLDPIAGGDLTGVTAARVEQNVDRSIKQQLHLTMLPDARLVDKTFRRYIKAYFRVGMPDQTEIEYPVGVYLWRQPARQLDARGIETWRVELGDRNHLLELAGPVLSGYVIPAGANVTRELQRILARVGMSAAGVVPSDDLVERKVVFDLRAHGTPPVGAHIDAQPSTWLRISHYLTDHIGYNSVWFDGDGVAMIRPQQNLNRVTPDVWYETGPDSIVTAPLDASSEISQFANRVTVRGQAPGGAPTVLTVDANQYAPEHPMAQRNMGLYVDVVLEQQFVLTPDAMRARATAALLRRLSCESNVTLSTLAWPVHGSFDVVGVRWEGDDAFDAGRIHHEREWSLDLFTGEMRHHLRRMYQAS